MGGEGVEEFTTEITESTEGRGWGIMGRFEGACERNGNPLP